VWYIDEVGKKSFILIAGVVAITASVALYVLHYFIFQDAHHIFIYLLGDLAFMPLEVFLVIILIERLLAQQERKSLQSKLNMVVGAFFMSVGNRLMAELLTDFREQETLYRDFGITAEWTRDDFFQARKQALKTRLRVDFGRIDLQGIKIFLMEQRAFLLTLMENPNLLEREAFTELLWAITHLAEELQARGDLIKISDADRRHLEGDINRFYDRLIVEWLNYAEHLKNHYPYFYSLLLRTHPFQREPSAEVIA
jgi:hypothetical protein